MIRYIYRYYATLKALNYKQIVYRIFKKTRRNLSAFQMYFYRKSYYTLGHINKNCEINFIEKNKSYLGNNVFLFLNIKKNINIDLFPDIIIENKLWQYNLNYFDYLNFNEVHNNKDELIILINQWIKNNSFLKIENDPYPTALRIINWIKWSIKNKYYEKNFLDSLYIQLLYLNKNIEFDLLGNHLFANAKALLIGSLFLKSKKTKKILKKALIILDSEIDEQINNDGSHCELSPMYHSIILEDILDIKNFFKIFNFQNTKINNKINNQILKMFEWLQHMQLENNKISFFNDSAYEIAPNLEKLLKYYESLDFINIIKKSNKSSYLKYFKNSGFVNSKIHDARIIIDLGKFGYKKNPGHAHADCLSFELAIFGSKFIVNSGTSTYQNDSLRTYQRSTKSHNTLFVENINSSDIWKSFRVGRIAKTKINKINFNEKDLITTILAQHDGFSNNLNKQNHTRKFSFKSNSLLIIDNITGDFKKAKINYFFHPEVKFIDSTKLMFKNKIINFKYFNSNISIKKSEWYPEFGKKVKNNYIQLLPNQNKCALKIQW